MVGLFGGDKGIRTPGLLNAIQARSQLRHIPKLFYCFAEATLGIILDFLRLVNVPASRFFR
jgi:hypothetical protein